MEGTYKPALTNVLSELDEFWACFRAGISVVRAAIKSEAVSSRDIILEIDGHVSVLKQLITLDATNG